MTNNDILNWREWIYDQEEDFWLVEYVSSGWNLILKGRKIAVSMGMVDRNHQATKLRKVSSGDKKTGSKPLPNSIHPNLNGIINLEYSIWNELKEEHKEFVSSKSG